MNATKPRKVHELDTIGTKQVKSRKTPKELFLKKRKNKAITKASMYRMFGLQDSPLLKDYRQAYKCNETIIKDEKTGKVTTYYCKKRCCTVCARIKSAQSLSKYGKAILDLDDLYMVTLTNTNVDKGKLDDEVSRMVGVIGKIRVNMRVQGYKLNGYKSFEVTHSWKTDFNPHFHFLLDGKEVAEMFHRLWLKHNPNADEEGQDIRKVGNTYKDLLEVFKYVAKPVTKGYYNPKAYDEIMCSLMNRRTTEPLGKIRGAKTLKNECTTDLGLDDLESQNIDWNDYTFNVWNYVNELHDWVSDQGECLIDEPLDQDTQDALEAINKPLNNEKETPKEYHPQDYTRIRYRTDRQILF
tara:strand:- start:621 stop:1682 length:1062 start_codon:yes stop_codon:yes gene_type:complete